jgi:hypothetical protein
MQSSFLATPTGARQRPGQHGARPGRAALAPSLPSWAAPAPYLAALVLAAPACEPASVPASAPAAGAARPAADGPRASVARRADWPADTVLALNGDPITLDEVDAAASIIARAENHHALPHLRRLALTNLVFPRLAARQLAGAQRRDAALAEARAWRAAQVAGAAPGPLAEPQAELVQDGFDRAGLELWDWALDAEPGTWSEPIETCGVWRVARVLERGVGLRPLDVPLKVDVRTFPWDPAPSFRRDVEAHLDRARLEYVDEAWRDLVPTIWQRRLRGSP